MLWSSGQGQQVVVTSGQDGLVRLFDLRQPAPAGATPEGLSRAVAEMRLPRKEEALSVSLGYGGTLAAVGGSRGLVHFFDLRSVGGGGGGGGSPPSLLGTYQDAHTDEVTGVRFQPAGLSGGTTSLLVTSSEDGLVCTHDTSQPSEELALASVLNVATPPREVGFFGPACEGLYCLTGSETVQIWHHDSAQRIFDFGDVRERLSQSSGLAVEYLVGCQWDGSDLSLAAGNSEGDAALFKVDAGSMSLTHTLSSGHKGCIRGCILSRDESEKRVLEVEEPARRHARRSLVASRLIRAGSVISVTDLICKRPGSGISPKLIDDVVGMTAKSDINEDERLAWEKLC